MSNDDSNSVVGDDAGPSYDREDSTDDSEVTMDTSPPSGTSEPATETGGTYECDHCDESFDTQSELVSHTVATHPEQTDETDETTATGRDSPVSWVWPLVNSLDGISDEETGDYTGPFSTPLEWMVGLIGLGMGMGIGHGVFTAEFVMALAFGGVVGSGVAGRKINKAAQDKLLSNSQSFAIAAFVGWLYIAFFHGNLDPYIDDLTDLVGQGGGNAQTIVFDTLVAVL